MSPRTLALALSVVLLGACTPEPAPGPAAPLFAASRTTLRALGDFAVAGYELRQARDRLAAGGDGRAADLERLEARLDAARDQLREGLREDGADPARLASDEALLPLVNEGVERSGRYAFVFPPDGESFAVVRITEATPERRVVLFGATLTYELVVHDETIVDDYPTWRAKRIAPDAVVHRPATYRAEARDGQWSGVVRVDAAAIRAVGERQWLPQVDALRDVARRAQDDAAFIALASEHAGLLGMARAALRWRSLEALWSSVASRPRDEQLARFTQDYAARAELRAVAELFELSRLRRPGDETPLSPEERATLHELGALSAMVHGEPLGVVADALAVSAASLAGQVATDDPTVLGARRLVVALGAQARGNETGSAQDLEALQLARIAHARPEDLRTVAAELHAERVAQLPR